jgi:hypothetical protein
MRRIQSRLTTRKWGRRKPLALRPERPNARRAARKGLPRAVGLNSPPSRPDTAPARLFGGRVREAQRAAWGCPASGGFGRQKTPGGWAYPRTASLSDNSTFCVSIAARSGGFCTTLCDKPVIVC